MRNENVRCRCSLCKGTVKVTGHLSRYRLNSLCVNPRSVKSLTFNHSVNQSVIVSVAKIAEAITKSKVAQLEDDARK